MSIRGLWVVGGLLLAGTAHAEGRSEGPAPHAVASAEKDADAYCRWVGAAARSDSDSFLFPQLFATAGEVSGADASSGGSALPPTQRLIAGASYSFGAQGLYHGLALRAQASAECRRYETTARLRAFVERNKDGLSLKGLREKARLLDESLPRAAEIVASQKARFAQQRLSAEEIDATLLRADLLRKLAADTHAQLDAQAAVPASPVEPIRRILAARDEAEAEAETGAARVRQSHSWDLSVRGGYDRIFGYRDYTPVFAVATLSVSLGWLFQFGNDADAADARRDWARAEVLGVDDRVEQVLELLKGTRSAEVQRLHDNGILLKDLEDRFRQVSAIEGERGRGYAESIWFDLVRVRAEHVYLDEHVRELTTLLSTDGP